MLSQAIADYTANGALLTGRFSRHSLVQAFPTFEMGLSGTYLFHSRKKGSLETWLSLYSLSTLSAVVWARPSFEFEITEDWTTRFSLDAGLTRGGLLLLGGLQLAHTF